jgi:hypothetical protein
LSQPIGSARSLNTAANNCAGTMHGFVCLVR